MLCASHLGKDSYGGRPITCLSWGAFLPHPTLSKPLDSFFCLISGLEATRFSSGAAQAPTAPPRPCERQVRVLGHIRHHQCVGLSRGNAWA